MTALRQKIDALAGNRALAVFQVPSLTTIWVVESDFLFQFILPDDNFFSIHKSQGGLIVNFWLQPQNVSPNMKRVIDLYAA
jgi:hypothetical protein